MEARIEQEKSRRVEEARKAFEQERPALSPEYALEVEAPLKRSDIHTFNELLQRVRQGSAPWPELTQRVDLFSEFYPVRLNELLSNLGKLERTEVDKLIRNGGSIGALSFELDGDEQARVEAEEVYKAWATGFARHKLDRENLRKVLGALGVPVRSLEQDKSGQGWTLFSETIDVREVCPVPHFGSRAQGRYRVVVLGDRASPEDLLQRIGDGTQHTATIVLSLTRSPGRFWPDLAKLSKEWIGVLGEYDTLIYVDQLLRSRRNPPKHHKLMVRQISALALWDLDLAGYLAAQSERVLFDVKTVLKSAREALDINAVLKDEAWEAGGSDQLDGAEMTLPFVLVERGDPERELSRRLWTAQAAELLPMIEVRRRELLKGLERHLVCPFNLDGVQVRSLDELEIGRLALATQRQGLRGDLRTRAEWLAGCRNKLAHLTALDSGDALDARMYG